MRRAALYARVSTGLQEKEQTIESQLAAITRYADEHGLRYSQALTYTDEGHSGTWLDRPALDELRDHAREGRFDVVVVLCPDRLARRYAYQVLLLEELKRAGIEVHFCERPINDSPDDQLLLQVQGAIAEYERAKILDRCRRGRLHRARRGELAPPRTPYGYTYSARKYGGDGKIRIHDEEAAMVRQLFAWYAAEGATLDGTLRKLNASPWKTRQGKSTWNAGTVLGMLRNEWYIGKAYYNRRAHRARPGGGAVRQERPRNEWIEVPVPRIIDKRLFARVQERVQENRRFARRHLRRERTYLLRGLLKCGVCGYAYLGWTQISRSKYEGPVEYPYYTCSMRTPLRSGRTDRCPSGPLMGAGADEIVWTTVRDLLLDSDALADRLQSWLARQNGNPADDERLRAASQRMSELRRQRERLIDAYQAGAIDLEDFTDRKTSIEERLLAVEHEQVELRSQVVRRDLAIQQVAGAENVVARLRDRLKNPDFATKQAILRLAVEKIVVTGHRLDIHWALPVSGGFDLTLDWRASLYSYRTGADSVNTEGPSVPVWHGPTALAEVLGELVASGGGSVDLETALGLSVGWGEPPGTGFPPSPALLWMKRRRPRGVHHGRHRSQRTR
jgi:site-specific DNA recombinase